MSAKTEWAVTYGGSCDQCRVAVTLTGGGIPDEHRPTIDKLDESLSVGCINCGNALVLPAVGITREPWRPQIEDDEDYDDDAPTPSDGEGTDK